MGDHLALSGLRLVFGCLGMSRLPRRVMAYIFMAYICMPCVDTAYICMAWPIYVWTIYVCMAYICMPCVDTAYIVTAPVSLRPI